mmetsp:Transcript_18894/g.30881  ORF Transcript_18894/g.30881 Transcript_18894/m.30881 type:complete len:96 (-) Transcript_18894:46-333(-)
MSLMSALTSWSVLMTPKPYVASAGYALACCGAMERATAAQAVMALIVSTMNRIYEFVPQWGPPLCPEGGKNFLLLLPFSLCFLTQFARGATLGRL